MLKIDIKENSHVHKKHYIEDYKAFAVHVTTDLMPNQFFLYLISESKDLIRCNDRGIDIRIMAQQVTIEDFINSEFDYNTVDYVKLFRTAEDFNLTFTEKNNNLEIIYF